MEINIASISWIFAAVVGGLALCFLAISIPLRSYTKRRDLEVLVTRMKTAAHLTYPSTASFEVVTERVKPCSERENNADADVANATNVVCAQDSNGQVRKKRWIARLVGKNAEGHEKILRGTEGRYRAKRADALYELHNMVAIDLAKSKERRKCEYDLVGGASGEGHLEGVKPQESV